VKRQIFLSIKNGFTLLEVLVAMVILMVGLLGMLNVINLAIATNVQNEMRNQAVAIGEDKMAQKKSLSYDDILTPTQQSEKVPLALRNSFVNYSVAYQVEEIPPGTLNPNTKRINIGVRWRYKGNNYEHVVSSIVTRPFIR
jgi:type IV pilus assembly protein PilV